MNELRVAIVDDEPLMRAELSRMLGIMPNVKVVAAGGTGLEALDLVHRVRPEALFLDIEMPELNGLEVVTSLPKESAPAVVFVTAYDHYAPKAFDLEAVDYLLKPFDTERLGRCLERVRARRRSSASLAAHPFPPRYVARLAVRSGSRVTVVSLHDVHFVSADGNYARLHTAKGEHLCRRTMRDLEAVFDPAQFCRIHRSTIVNLSSVRDLRPATSGDWVVRLTNDWTLRVSRSYRETFVARLGRIG